MNLTRPHTAAFAVVFSSLAFAACGDSGGTEESFKAPVGSDDIALDPADFRTEIDNPYWPMRPGSRWVYREPGEKGRSLRVEITVTEKTKVVDGIETRVVHDVVSDERTKRPVEVTDDWYAQDKFGNVWYLGEDTQEYENGKPTTKKGSWEAGENGAQAGVIVLSEPQVGDEYRQEYLAGEAEDAARVLSRDERVRVPLDAYENCLMTRDFTPLDPEVLEYKYYAEGVGPVLTIDVPTGDREELISFEAG